MSDFKAKMHQIRFRLGLCPRPHWGSLQRSPDPQLDLRGLHLREGKGEKRGRDEREGREEKGGEGRGEGRGGDGGEGRGQEALSGNVAEEAFCLKSTPGQ